MGYLANPAETKMIIDRFGFSFKKKYGQNFLIDENIVKKIVHTAEVSKERAVLEIGPGIGTMTQVLCEEAKSVVAVEIDKKLIPVLDFTLEEYSDATVINDDILKCDLAEISKKYNNSESFDVVANLPYYITTPIIMGLLEANSLIKRGDKKDGGTGRGVINSITVMIQKEVAERINAKPGKKDYGALTLAVQYYTKPRILMTVPASCFMPRPNVDSTVIRLDLHDEPPYKVKNEKMLFSLIKAAFAQRRKTFINSAGNTLGIEKESLRTALDAIGRDENIRGEVLSLEEFVRLADIIDR